MLASHWFAHLGSNTSKPLWNHQPHPWRATPKPNAMALALIILPDSTSRWVYGTSDKRYNRVSDATDAVAKSPAKGHSSARRHQRPLLWCATVGNQLHDWLSHIPFFRWKRVVSSWSLTANLKELPSSSKMGKEVELEQGICSICRWRQPQVAICDVHGPSQFLLDAWWNHHVYNK